MESERLNYQQRQDQTTEPHTFCKNIFLKSAHTQYFQKDETAQLRIQNVNIHMIRHMTLTIHKTHQYFAHHTRDEIHTQLCFDSAGSLIPSYPIFYSNKVCDIIYDKHIFRASVFDFFALSRLPSAHGNTTQTMFGIKIKIYLLTFVSEARYFDRIRYDRFSIFRSSIARKHTYRRNSQCIISKHVSVCVAP